VAKPNSTEYIPQASLTINVPDKPEGVYDLDPLARTIEAEKSTFKVGKLKVELILAKAQPGLKWKELDGIDEEGADSATIAGAGSPSTLFPKSTCQLHADATI